MSEPNKDGTDIMMALLMGLSGPRASKAWNESQQIKAESFLTMAEHWINQTAEENARLKAEVERLEAELSNITGWGRGLESDLSWARAELMQVKAEVERLDTLCKQLMAQHSDISCENIMLRKAGDGLHSFLINYIVESRISSAYLNKLDDGWNAAKEGKGQP